MPTATASVEAPKLRTGLLLGLSFLQSTGGGLIFVFLADVQDRYGLASWQIGVLAATSFIASLVTQLGLSPLLDRGHVAPLAWLSLVAAVAGTLGFAFGTTAVVLTIARGLSGLGHGLFNVVARKALLGLTTDGGGEKLGKLLSAGVAGFLAGPALGALLSPIAFEAPFVLLAVLFVVVGVPAAAEASRATVAAAPVDYAELGRVVRDPRMQVAMLTQIAVFGAIGMFDSTIDRFLTDLGESTTAVAITLVVIGLPLMVLPPIAGRLAERIGGLRVLLPALALIVPTVAFWGWSTGALTFAAIGLVYTFCESFAIMGGQLLVLDATGTERAAVGNAAIEVVGLTTAAATSVGSPVLYGAAGARVMYGTWAAVAAVLLIGVLVRSRWASTRIMAAA